MMSRTLMVLWLGLVLTTPAEARTLAEIEARGELRVCFSAIEPALVRVEPEGCTVNCQYAGLLVDQVALFADTLNGISVVPKSVSWSDQFSDETGQVQREESYLPELLASGACDLLVSNLARLPWRLRKMDIVPLFESRMIAIVRADRQSEFTTLDSFAGKSAVVSLESSFHTWLLERNMEEFTGNPVQVVPLDGRVALDLVFQDKVDFTLTDADIAVLSIPAYGADLVPAFAVGPVQELGWGVDPADKELRAAIEMFFADQKPDPRSALNRAWQQHLGVTIPEFEALVNALPGTQAADGSGKNGD